MLAADGRNKHDSGLLSDTNSNSDEKDAAVTVTPEGAEKQQQQQQQQQQRSQLQQNQPPQQIQNQDSDESLFSPRSSKVERRQSDNDKTIACEDVHAPVGENTYVGSRSLLDILDITDIHDIDDNDVGANEVPRDPFEGFEVGCEQEEKKKEE